MAKRVWLSVFFVHCSFLLFSQIGTGVSLSDRLYFGGGFGFNTGTSNGYRYTYIALNPVIGYKITDRLSAGTGVNWQRFNYPDVNVKLDQYGVSPFVRYNFDQLFAYGEYNLLSTPTFNTSTRKTFDRLLVGAGYSQPLGRRGALNAMALYDLLYDNLERAFPSPWVFRVFFTF